MLCIRPVHAMPHETFANALGTSLPASGWRSWAPEVTDRPEALEADRPVDWLGGVLSLVMWGCASLLAVWYL